MSEVKETICKTTGLSAAAFDEILQEVKNNQAKLKTCPAHDFSICLDRRTKEPVNEPTQRFGANWRCSRCGGDVDCHAKNWYELGVKHATDQMMKS